MASKVPPAKNSNGPNGPGGQGGGVPCAQKCGNSFAANSTGTYAKRVHENTQHGRR